MLFIYGCLWQRNVTIPIKHPVVAGHLPIHLANDLFQCWFYCQYMTLKFCYPQFHSESDHTLHSQLNPNSPFACSHQQGTGLMQKTQLISVVGTLTLNLPDLVPYMSKSVCVEWHFKLSLLYYYYIMFFRPKFIVKLPKAISDDAQPLLKGAKLWFIIQAFPLSPWPIGM